MRDLITIAIPTYNDAATVADTLASIVAQSSPVESVLIVDDASADDTLEIVRKFQDRLPLRILKNTSNLGLVGNWNRCLAESRSNFTWILHSDDWLHPHANEALQEQLISFQGGLVYVGAQFFADPKCEAAVRWRDAPSALDWISQDPGCAAMKDSLSYICSGVVVAQAAYETVGGFSAKFPYSPDEELWLRIAQKHQTLSCRTSGLVAVRSSGIHYMHETWRRPDFQQRWMELHEELLALAAEGFPIDLRDKLCAAIVSKRDGAWKMIGEHSRPETRLGRITKALHKLLN